MLSNGTASALIVVDNNQAMKNTILKVRIFTVCHWLQNKSNGKQLRIVRQIKNFMQCTYTL